MNGRGLSLRCPPAIPASPPFIVESPLPLCPWTTSRERAYLDNLHLTLWHVDERDKAGVEDGWGAVLSFSRYIGDKWMPFLRAGYAKDGGSLLQKSVSAGIGYQPNPIGGAAGNLLGTLPHLPPAGAQHGGFQGALDGAQRDRRPAD